MQPSGTLKPPMLVDCLRTPHAPLAHLLQHIQRIQQANLYWLSWTKALQYTPCNVVDVTHTRLILKTTQGPLAHLLRFEAPDILIYFQQHPTFRTLTQVLVRVQPFIRPTSSVPTYYTPPPCKPLTTTTQALLANTAHSIQHPALKAALERLAGGSSSRHR